MIRYIALMLISKKQY